MKSNILKAISIMLVIALIAGVFSIIPVSAADVFISGDGFTFVEKKDGTLELNKYDGSEASVTIPAEVKTLDSTYKVTSIGKYAFDNNQDIVSVILSDEIKSIEDDAFNQCRNLSAVRMSENIEHLGDDAFYYCISLDTIKIPATLKTCGTAPFESSGLRMVNFEYGLTAIPDHLLNGAGNLEYANFPSTVTKLGKYIFQDCVKLESVTIPSSVTYAKNAFGFGGVKTVTFARGSKEICDNMFEGADYLEKIVVPDTLTRIGVEAFRSSAIANVDFLSNIKEIGDRAFYSCFNIKAMTFPATLEKCGENLFWYSGVEKVVFEEGTKTIFSSVCEKAEKLKSVSLPSSVTRIESGAFYNCTSLQSARLPYYLEYLGTSAFANCTNLKSVTFQPYLTDCGVDPFEGSGLETVKFANGTKTIPGGLLSGCELLSSVTIPEGVETIGDSVFTKSTNLKSINLPSTLIECSGAFIGSSLVSVTIADGMKKIPDGMFLSCSDLSDINIPSSVTSIGEYAFEKCESLTEIDLSENLESVGRTAFHNCVNLKSVTIPESIKDIGNYAFGYYSTDRFDSYNTMGKAFTVYGYSDTVAKTYADKNELRFVPLDYTPMIGDVDNNGIVNITDATLIQKYCAKLVGESDINLDVADVNNDGEINISDATAIQKMLVA